MTFMSKIHANYRVQSARESTKWDLYVDDFKDPNQIVTMFGITLDELKTKGLDADMEDYDEGEPMFWFNYKGKSVDLNQYLKDETIKQAEKHLSDTVKRRHDFLEDSRYDYK